MTKILEIKSKGLIDEKAIKLIGASTKRGNEEKIGMFGTGLNYSICAMLRQEIPFYVFSGNDEIKISTKEVEFSGHNFNVVCVNGAETSLTDSMGTEDWDGVYPFIREIYSNALDVDSDSTIKLVDDIVPEDGYTKFYIESNNDIINVVSNLNDFFIEKDTSLFTSEYGSIHPNKAKASIFRKGILAKSCENTKSCFSYNLNNVEINESRTVKNVWEAYREIGKLIESCTDKRILTTWLNFITGGNAGSIEHEAIVPSYWNKIYNPVLIDFILQHKYAVVEMKHLYTELDLKDRKQIPLGLCRRFLAYAPDADVLGLNKENQDAVTFVEKIPPTDLVDKVNDAIIILKKTRYATRLYSSIKYGSFYDSNTLGMAKNNTILLSTKLDTYSVAEIAKIIIEEQEHLTTGFEDETRNFQNHLFNLYYNEITRDVK